MKIPIITDTHFGARNDAEIFTEYFYKFLEEVFFPYLEVNEIKTILHLGDLVDRRKYINFKTLNKLRTRFVGRLESMGVETHLILGNHDVFFKNTSELNAVTELFAEYKQLHIYSDPCVLEFDGVEIGLVPWINPENHDTSLRFLETTTAGIIMGHLEISGFQVMKGIVVDEGLDRNVFRRFEAVYTGHYHHRQQSGNITYLGCPYQITFADLGDTKGFHVFDTETREMEFVANPYHMFHKIFYDDVNTDYDTTADKSKYKNCYVKIVVLNKTKPYIFDRFLDSFYDAGVAHVTVVEDSAVDEDDPDAVNMEMDTMTLIAQEIDAMDHLDNPDKLKTIIQSLYVEALEQ